MYPDIPPNLLGIVDTIGFYQQIDIVLVLRITIEGSRDPGSRELVEHLLRSTIGADLFR